MEALPVHVFKGSFGPIIDLLNENNVKYQIHQTRAGVPMAASTIIEIVQSAAAWGGLATVLVSFIKARSGRKVTITTKDNVVIHAEGLTAKELENILKQAKSLAAIDTNSNDKSPEKS